MGGRPHRNRVTHWIETGGPAQRGHAGNLAGDPLPRTSRVSRKTRSPAQIWAKIARATTSRGANSAPGISCMNRSPRLLTSTLLPHAEPPLPTASDRVQPQWPWDGTERTRDRAGQLHPGCQRQPASFRTQRIGGVRVEPADPACCQHNGSARDQDRLIAFLRSSRDADHTGHGAVAIQRQIGNAMVLQDLNGGRLPDGMDKGVQNTPAGSIPIRMNDPPARVRGFQPQDQAIPGRGSIKTGALSNQPFDAGRGGRRHTCGNIRIAEARTRLKGVGCVQGRVVVCPDSCRDPALRQRRGGVLPRGEATIKVTGSGARCRAVASPAMPPPTTTTRSRGLAVLIAGPQRTASMRSTASRARAATPDRS